MNKKELEQKVKELNEKLAKAYYFIDSVDDQLIDNKDIYEMELLNGTFHYDGIEGCEEISMCKGSRAYLLKTMRKEDTLRTEFSNFLDKISDAIDWDMLNKDE